MPHHEGRRQITVTLPSSIADMLEAYSRSETAKHVRGIRRELLLAMRALIDARLESTAEDEAGKGEKSETAKKADVK